MKMIIDGKLTDSVSGQVFNNINPFNGEIVCTVPSGCAEDYERAAVIAKKAQPLWADTPFYKRAEIIQKFIGLVKENINEIAAVVCHEGGKLIGECKGELDCLCVVFENYVEAARYLYGHTIPMNAEPRTEGDVIFTIREPIGVFVTITPFNFPVELYAHKVAPTIISGNSVIIKPASDTPMSAMMLTELLLKAGIPSGVAQLITGSGKTVGDWLGQTKNVDAVSFTGSTAVGMELMRGGANNLEHVFLELGGNDPFVVFDDCDLDLAVSMAVGGRAYNAGQTCCANKRFIIQNTVKEAFTVKLIESLKKLKSGDPFDPATQMGPQVSEKAARIVISQIEYTVGQGATIIFGGKRSGSFIEPTVLKDVTTKMDIAHDLEVFGPVFPIIGFNTFDEALSIANDTSYGLASGVMTKDINKAIKFASKIKAGACVINSSGNYRSVHQPFGGYKHSGIGREGTTQTLYETTQEKTIVIKDALKKD